MTRRILEAVAGLVEACPEHLDVVAHSAHRLLGHAPGVGEVCHVADLWPQPPQVGPNLIMFTAQVAIEEAHAG